MLSIKDYIKNPKESGYKSYHMLVSVPIFLSDSVVDTKVEIQIRTIAMDFWASLEHKIYYKFEGNAPEYISRELRECAEMVSTLDEKMLSLNEAIQDCLEKHEELKTSTTKHLSLIHIYSHTSEEVMELMQKVVREQKKTLVMVTHDQHLAAYADRIFHIRDGKILKIEENLEKILREDI